MSIVLSVKERGIIRRNKSTVDARQLKLSRDRENSSNGAESLRYCHGTEKIVQMELRV